MRGHVSVCVVLFLIGSLVVMPAATAEVPGASPRAAPFSLLPPAPGLPAPPVETDGVAPGLSWVRETVEQGPTGQQANMQLGPDGRPVISYYDQRGGDLKLASRSADGAWSIDTVHDVGNTGKFSSLAFLPSGTPAIVYFDATQGALKFTEKISSGWISSVIATTTVSASTGFAIHADGSRFVAWATSGGALMAATSSGALWTITQLDSKIASGSLSLALDARGEPAIAYARTTTDPWHSELRYIARAQGAWTAPVVVDAGGRVGTFASLRFASTGHPVIAYSNLTAPSWNNWTTDLATFDGSAWSTQSLLAHGATGGYYASLTLDPQDCPSVAYWRVSPPALRAVRSDCSTWSSTTIDQGAGAYWYITTTTSQNGFPLVAYWENNADGSYKTGLRFAQLGLDPCYASTEPCEDQATPAPPLYPLHAPIVVEGDIGLLAPTSGVTNPLAAGTQADPYIIEHMSIVGPPSGQAGGVGAGITLRGTTKHVIIQHAQVETVDDIRSVGIWLTNASNVTLRDVVFQGNVGFWVGVSNPSLGVIWDGAGLLVDQASHDITVAQNTFTGGYSGVQIQGGSFNIDVDDNRFTSMQGIGVIDIRGGAGITVHANEVVNSQRGFYAALSPPAHFYDNVVDRAYIAFTIYSAEGTIVENNTFRDSYYGGLVSNANQSFVRDNFIDHAYYDGIQVGPRSKGNVLENNTIRDAGSSGVWVLGTSLSNTITHNVITSNSQAGIRVSGSNATAITANHLTRNAGGGVTLSTAFSTTIHHNDFRANGVGVSVSASPGTDARWNWWGSASGPGVSGADRLSGSAAASPWLSRPLLAFEPIPVASGTEGAPVSFFVRATAVDGDPLSYTASGLPGGATLDGPSGLFSWTPARGQVGGFDVTIEGRDGALSVSAPLHLDIARAPNHPPSFRPLDGQVVEEDKLLEFTTEASDVDGDGLRYSATGLPLGAAYDETSGAFSWTPSFDQAGSVDVVFSVTDGEATVTQGVSIVVLDVNRAPVLAPIADRSVPEGAVLSFTIEAADPDGDAMTLSMTNAPPGSSFDPVSRTFAWTPDHEQAGMYRGVRFDANDGALASSQTMNVTVTATNRAPVLDRIEDNTTTEGTLLTFTIAATDPDGDPISYAAGNLPGGAAFDAATRSFSWTPSYQQAGAHVLRFSASDGELIASRDVTIQVIEVDRAPVLDPIPRVVVKEGATLTVKLHAVDADGTPITFSFGGLGPDATLTDHTNGRATLTWTPGAYWAGTYPVTVRATSGPATAERTFDVTVVVSAGARLAPAHETLVNTAPRETTLLTVELVNTGARPDTFSIAVTAPSDWEIVAPPRLTLGQGSSTVFAIQVRLPDHATRGNVKITATSSEDTTASAAVTFTIQTPVRVSLQLASAQPAPGDWVSGTVTLRFLDGTPAPAGIRVRVEQELQANGLERQSRSSLSGVTAADGSFAFDFDGDPLAALPGSHRIIAIANVIELAEERSWPWTYHGAGATVIDGPP